jgi:hypothetical protein
MKEEMKKIKTEITECLNQINEIELIKEENRKNDDYEKNEILNKEIMDFCDKVKKLRMKYETYKIT